MKKYIVLSILFILPITAYIFFALSTTYFRPLPTLTENISELDGFYDLDGEKVQLQNKITILGFFGEDLESRRAYAYNLGHKIYGRYHEFNDFQFVILLPKGTEDQARIVLERIEKIAPTDAWHFAFGTEEQLMNVFHSLNVPISLTSDYASPYVFIIDKERNLRGRDDDKEEGIMYGYDSSSIAELNNKMEDDLKVILVEYRRALKKYDYDVQREI